MERNKACTCKWCGQSFEAVHYNAETCSPKCRKAYSRWLADVDRIEHELSKLLDQLTKYHGRDGSLKAELVAKMVYRRSKDMVDYWG